MTRSSFDQILSWLVSACLPLLVLASCGRPIGEEPDAGPELACLPGTCPGCCTAEGECLPGDQASACGSGAAECLDCAALGGTCSGGQCQGTGPCNGETCPGCCDAEGQCRSGALPEACGRGGEACRDCGDLACSAGHVCIPGCVDRDGDGYGEGCEAGPDCDDLAPGIHDGCEPGEPCPEGWVHVPAGPFLAGCDPEGPFECREHDVPLQEIDLPAYCIQRTEVSVGAFRPCLEAGYCGEFSQHQLDTMDRREMACNWSTDPAFDRVDHPMNCVPWWMARQYCTAWLGGDLPSEWQWEKAARGTDGRTFPWGEDPPDCSRCNVSDYCRPETASKLWPVGSVADGSGDSPYGIADMCGNVRELTRSSIDRPGEDFDPNLGDLVIETRGGMAYVLFPPLDPDFYPDFAVYNRVSPGVVTPTIDAFGDKVGLRCVRPPNGASLPR